MEIPIIDIPSLILGKIDGIWTFMLLSTRFLIMFQFLPGLTIGPSGKMIRWAGILSIVYVAFLKTTIVAMPGNIGLMVGQLVSEALFGLALGVIPLLIIAGVQMAGSLSATTMGLGAGQLLDPTSGISVTPLARLLSDLMVLLFLALDGHHLFLYTASGLSGSIVPGTFLINESSVNLILNRFGDMFRIGTMVATPVIVALLLTNFVLGLITKAIPQVNIFIISFPLTIGIGLVLSALSLPEVFVFIENSFSDLEPSILSLLQNVTT